MSISLSPVKSLVGDDQPPMSRDAFERSMDRVRRTDAAFRAEIPKLCPWLGHRDVAPVFVTNRRTWICGDCRREFTQGV